MGKRRSLFVVFISNITISIFQVVKKWPFSIFALTVGSALMPLVFARFVKSRFSPTPSKLPLQTDSVPNAGHRFIFRTNSFALAAAPDWTPPLHNLFRKQNLKKRNFPFGELPESCLLSS